MSLFETSPEDPSGIASVHRKPSLFADERTLDANPTSLFADSDLATNSPSMNNTKKAARRELAKTLLPTTDVPDSYIDAYDLVLNREDRAGSGIGLTTVRGLLAESGLNATDQGKILDLVISGDDHHNNDNNASGLGRGEFNVLLALMGLAQEGEPITFDAVDERRQSKACSLFPSFIIATVRGLVRLICVGLL